MSYKGNSYRVSEDHTGVTKNYWHIYHYRCYHQFEHCQHPNADSIDIASTSCLPLNIKSLPSI